MLLLLGTALTIAVATGGDGRDPLRVAARATYLLMRVGVVSELGAYYLVAGRTKGSRERRLKCCYAHATRCCR